MSVERAPQSPSPLAGEDVRARSARAGEGPREPTPPRLTAPPGPSPAARRAAPSPARGEGNKGAGTSSVSRQMRRRAQDLRLRMTDAERQLWYALRDRRFAGFKFRRQVPLGPFIVDFVCFEERLVIEVDGGQHAESLKDQRRDRWFAANKFRVLRFWNNEVLSNLEGVITSVAQTLRVQWS